MPYFYKEADNLNLLFIHIPKTGGTSFENYMSQKYNIPLNYKSLYKYKKGESSTYQHFPIRYIWSRKDEFGINQKDLRIIAFVRDPYDRTISDLFYNNLINQDTRKEQVANILKKYLASNNTFDNHKIPQYKFLIDDQEEFWPNIEIVRTENLKQGLVELGFDDFNNEDFVNKAKLDGSNINYSDYLNDDSMKMIETYYANDFEAFNYPIRSQQTMNEGFTPYKNGSNLFKNSLQEDSIWIFMGIAILTCLGYQFLNRKKLRFKLTKTAF